MKHLLYLSLFLPFAFPIDDNNNIVKMLYNVNRVPRDGHVERYIDVPNKGYQNFDIKYDNVPALSNKEYGNGRYDKDGAIASHDYGNNLEPYETTDNQKDLSIDKSKSEVLKWLDDLSQTDRTAEPLENTVIPQTKYYEIKNTAELLFKLTKGVELLNENLNKLNSVLKTINAEIFALETSQNMENLENTFRIKRDVNNDSLVNSTQGLSFDKNGVSEESENQNLGNQTDATKDSRRSMNNFYTEIRNDVKSKLLVYFDNAFLALHKKIAPVNGVKMTFSPDNSYKIGYIIAILDTLEANLRKLKQDAVQNNRFWDNAKILELFDKLKASDNVLTNLLISLKSFVETRNQYV